jgi:hypothetical protein
VVGHEDLLTAALALVTAGSVILWRVQSPYCPDCPHCRNIAHQEAEKRRMNAEAEDRRLHENFHKMYPLELGDPACNWCRKSGGPRR